MNEFTPYGFPEPTDDCLQPTEFLDFDKPAIQEFVARVLGGETDRVARAVRLFYAVRDEIRYDIFAIRLVPEIYRASDVLAKGRAFCIPKAVLLTAAARAAGIPAVLGLSDVVNHFTSPKVETAMGGKTVFLHHGYAALYLDGEWIKAAPAFNKEMCEKAGVQPTEFDGRSHAILQGIRRRAEPAHGVSEGSRLLDGRAVQSDQGRFRRILSADLLGRRRCGLIVATGERH